MALEKKIKVEMEIWCSDPREFENLLYKLASADLRDCTNGRFGGYGYEIKEHQFTEDKIRKALGFKKAEI